MRGLARWCMVHRRRVAVVWVAVAILATVLAHAVGPNYVTVFGLPGTQSQRASDLLKQEFKAQSGDVDTIVFHVSQGTVDSPRVRATIAFRMSADSPTSSSCSATSCASPPKSCRA